MKTFVYALLVLSFINFKGYAQNNTIQLTESKVTPVIDGVLNEKEWKDAKEITINRKSGEKIIVRVKYDTENLFVAFENLADTLGIRLNPEVVIHTDITNLSWNGNCYWFHASYSNCSSIGEYYNWEECSESPAEWNANLFPFVKENDNIEFKISFDKLNTHPIKGAKFKIAFKLSDPLDQHTYWPKAATIAKPQTWGLIIF